MTQLEKIRIAADDLTDEELREVLLYIQSVKQSPA